MGIEPRRLTSGPAHHFFGYYGINAWDRTGRHHSSTAARQRRRTAPASAWWTPRAAPSRPWAETGAFNLQQGSMLHGLDAGHDEELAYNTWQGERVESHARALQGGATRTLEAPVAAVTGDGRAELVVSHAQVIRAAALSEPPSGLVWFNHVTFNTDGSRVMFLCRMRRAGGQGMHTSLWTIRPDGSELSLQIGFPHRISHFAWLDPDRLLISTDLLGTMQFITFTVDQDDFTPFGGGVLPPDGHACFSPDGRWLACDTYPQGEERTSALMLYEMATGRRVDIGGMYSEPVFTDDVRCDLHPRWHPDGRSLTIDAVPDGNRQIYQDDL